MRKDLMNKMTLESLRIRMNFTQKQVSDMLGVSEWVYRKFENDSSIIPKKYFVELSKIYQYPEDYIFLGKKLSFAKQLKRESE